MMTDRPQQNVRHQDASAPTSLLSHVAGTGSTNCLAQAARMARDGLDEIVFLSALNGSPDMPGHVVLRDTQTGATREPHEGVTVAGYSPDAYAAKHNMAVLCTVPSAIVREVFEVRPAARAQAIAMIGGPLAQIAQYRFGGVSTVGPADSKYSTEDQDVHAWLDALGDSVSDDDKKALAQTGDDAQTLKAWFDAHKRGDPALNNMPQNVADAENRLFANDAVGKQLTVDGVVTRDAIGSFIKNLDSSARSAKGSFENFESSREGLDPGARHDAASVSILQANVTVLDAAGGTNAKIDKKFNLDDLKAVASGENDAGLPSPLKAAAAHYTEAANFSTLAGAGGANKEGTIQDSNFDTLLSDGVGFSRQDTHVQAWLDGLGSSVSDDDKKALAQLGNDTTTLKAWFDSHDRGDPALNTMPQNVADAENRLFANDAVGKQLTVDGVVTRDAVGSFLSTLDKAADSAKGSFESFKKDNPSASPVALQEAVAASILQANLPVLDGAGTNAKVDQKFNLDDLKAIASGSGLPDPLKHAASLFANSGEFAMLANSGLDASTVTDGLVNNANLDKWLSKGTGKSEADMASRLKSDALQQAVTDAGGDASKVNGDYFNGGHSDATGADKAAALIQLSQTIGRYNSGESQFKEGSPAALDSPDQYHQYYDGPTPGEERDQFIKDVQSRIDTLSKDKDVQAFVADKLPGATQAIVAGDPALKAAMQTEFDANSGSQALQDAFAQKDVSTADALNNFLGKANSYAQALGITPDYTKALADAPQDIKDRIKQGYADITSGKTIDDLVKNGTPQDKAIIQATVDKTLYDSVLDKDSVQAGTDAFNDSVTKLARVQVTDGLSPDDMLKGLGVTDIDDPKLLQLIEDNIGTLATSGKGQPPSTEILAAIRQVDDAMRGGLKFDDAMAKVQKDWKPIVPGGAVTDAYKAGVFHGASAVLLAGAMGSRLAAGGGSNLQTAQQSLGVAGLLTEGGAKYYGTTLKGLQDSVKGDKAAFDELTQQSHLGELSPEQTKQLAQYQAEKDNLSKLTNISKDVENVGKGLGGVAGNALGLVLGAIGAKNSADSGDIGGAAAQGIFAGLNGISTIAGIGEVVTYVLPRIGVIAATESLAALGGESLAALGGLFGAVAGAVGFVAAIGGFIYAIVASIKADEKKAKQEDAWYKELQDGFAPSGLTLPSLGTLISAPNGYVPDDSSNDFARY